MAKGHEITPMATSPQSAIEEEKTLRLMIAGGGTGGHLYIGIAVAKELQRRHPDHDVMFVGTCRGLEACIVPREGFRLEYISSAGLKGVGLMRAARNFMIIPKSLQQSRRLVRSYAPHVVLGVGGYSSGPAVLAAWLMRKPTMIMEPNAYPGLANRWLSRVVDRVALALPDTGNYFGSKAVVTGIPVRGEFLATPGGRHQRGRMTLLIYGGSQGSHALNSIVCGALGSLGAIGPGLRLIHQTGEKELQAVRDAYRKAGANAEVRAFLPRIYEEFAAADLILSRAGASTIAELTAAGKAAILVPFPGAADDHQTKNALALERHGAARIIPESEWDPGRLAREIRHYMENPEEIEHMEEAARQLAKPDATQKIVDILVELGGRGAAVAAGAGRN
jgi:UDP-N-acetylglucosamine--N-acetylmuramyl-(pentapeptide) pyrophosphoryl-undecaprenol N-acetylglucosamine transferase